MTRGGNSSGAKYPNKYLSSVEVRDCLQTQIVQPVVNSSRMVCAFRLIWRGTDGYCDQIWENIAEYHQLANNIVKAVPGVDFFVSSVSATASWKYHKKEKTVQIFPAIAFWVVTEVEDFCRFQCQLLREVDQNRFGASAKLLNAENPSRGQAYADTICKTLFTVMKDVQGNYVETRMETISPSGDTALPIVTVCIRESSNGDFFNDMYLGYTKLAALISRSSLETI